MNTVTSVPGVTAVQVLINGGTPIGLFPGVDATVPLTPEALATPNVPATAPVTAPTGPVSASTRAVQERLAALGYLLPSDVDGVDGPGTQTAVVAFQKWQGLPRDRHRRRTDARGARHGASGRRRSRRARRRSRRRRGAHRSSARARDPGQPGRPRDRRLHRQALDADAARLVLGLREVPEWWSTPFREWLLWASPFTGGFAMHQFPDVPTYAASHGCVRVTQYDAKWVYDFASVGTPVHVMASST